MDDFKKYYLDLKSLYKLEDKDYRDVVNSYYQTILCYIGERQSESANYKSVFNTLLKTGLLKNIDEESRSEKIDEIIGE